MLRTQVLVKVVERIEMEETTNQVDFEVDIVKMIIELMVPVSILDNPALRKFLLKYTKYKIPYSNDVRNKDIINKLSETVLEQIRNDVD